MYQGILLIYITSPKTLKNQKKIKGLKSTYFDDENKKRHRNRS